jgi:hypothetical protein
MDNMSSTPDRKILRAFYTQYVAVLLIILVLIIGSSRGMFPRDLSATGAVNYEPTPKQFGSISVGRLFETEHSAKIIDTSQLEAIAETLRNHDIRAKLFLSSSNLLDNNQAYALERASAVRQWMLSQNLPSSAFSVVLTQRTGSDQGVLAVFESMEIADEVS